MKKLISLFLSTALLLMLSISASAEETVEISKDVEKITCINLKDMLRGNQPIGIQSTETPTKYHDLNSSRYYAKLTIVGNAWLYTNYYFHPNSDGKLNIQLGVITRPSTSFFGAGSDQDSTLNLGIFDLTSNKFVETQKYEITKNTLFTKTVSISNLTQSHNYAVCFRSWNQPVTGAAVIYH